MNILFAATPAPGHLNPLLAIARMAKARGDDVTVTTGSVLAPLVNASGLHFAPLMPAADRDYRNVDKSDPERALLPPGPAQLRYDFERFFLDPMPAQAESLRQLISTEAPDLIVVDSLFLGSTPIFLDKIASRPPLITCSASILTLERPDGAPLGPGLPPAQTPEVRGRYAAIAAQADSVFKAPVQTYADAKLAEMGIGPLDSWLMHARVFHCDAFLMLTAPSFEYDFGDLPSHVHFVGALPAPPAQAPLPDWWAELDGSRKVVLVTQGTVTNVDFTQLIEPTLAALADRDDLLILVTTGGRSISELSCVIPDTAKLETFLPFGELLPKVDVLVTNGGYGTVMLALKAGVPIVVSGLSEDKAEVAARVAWSGAGVNLASDKPAVEAIRWGVDAALADPRYRSRAGEIAADFAAIDTQTEILAVMDRLVARDSTVVNRSDR